MFDHLVHAPAATLAADFKDLANAEPSELFSAQAATSAWLQDLGATPDDLICSELETASARKAFGSLTTNTSDEVQKNNLLVLKTPAAVQHLTGMLTAYDWEFVQQAKELRGYTVAKILEETNSPNASIRLKALALLGKVTEIGLFTEKIEVKKTELTDSDLEHRIKEKLYRFMGVVDIEEAVDAT